VLADYSLQGRKRWITGANKRDHHLDYAVPGRDFKEPEYGDFTTVFAGDPCVRCGTKLEIYRGIEVGHVFKLGTKYSESMHCEYLDESGKRPRCFLSEVVRWTRPSVSTPIKVHALNMATVALRTGTLHGLAAPP
jgi:prolyl-tRNA synthetase